MKNFGLIFLVACLLLCMMPVSATDTVDDASVNSGCSTLDGKVPFLGTERLVKNGKAMVLYEANTDTLMYTDNADTQLSPASLVKILTALIAIEEGAMTDVVTVSQEVLSTLDQDAAMVDPKLVVGEVLTVKDLLYCMMVASGNDAAVVLADHIMGNQATFVAEMNRYVAELGCTGTNFTNVHGLHDENQYTTARDMTRILERAIQNQQFCEIFGAKKYIVSATNKTDDRILLTQNHLMNADKIGAYDERVTGSRTGIANDRTRNVASVAQANGMQLICVVMGTESPDDTGGYSETRQLLNLGFDGHKTTQLLHENQVLLQSSVPNGSSDVTIGTKNAVFSVIPDTTDGNSLVYRYVNEEPLTAPIHEGQRISTLQIWSGNTCIAQSDLYAMCSVQPAGQVFTKDHEQKRDVNVLQIILYILGVCFAVGFLFVIVKSVPRATQLARKRRQSRRNSRSRRRSR